jgi:hypothetical protein
MTGARYEIAFDGQPRSMRQQSHRDQGWLRADELLTHLILPPKT